jgi:hypothetical protein
MATLSTQGDAEHIHRDEQRETANSDREIDVMHWDLSEAAPSAWIQERPSYPVVVIRPMP